MCSMRAQTHGNEPWLVVLAASAGGIKALGTVLGDLPADLPAAIIVVQHRSPTGTRYLERILSRRARMPVVTAESGTRIAPGVIYVARPDLHLTVGPDKRLAYVDGTRIRFLLSSANPLLETAAPAFDGHLLAVVLTGSGTDATDGVQNVKACGGLVIAQDRASSEYWSMPESALRSGAVDYVLPLTDIAPAIEAIVHGRPVEGAAAAS
jgi:two-component system, chemotaxis family, protein-glutamate methylesterase/glutaminase